MSFSSQITFIKLTRKEHCCITQCKYHADILDRFILPSCLSGCSAIHRQSLRHIRPQTSDAIQHWHLYRRHRDLLYHEQLCSVYCRAFSSRDRGWRLFCSGLGDPRGHHSSSSEGSLSSCNFLSLVICCDNRCGASPSRSSFLPMNLQLHSCKGYSNHKQVL